MNEATTLENVLEALSVPQHRHFVQDMDLKIDRLQRRVLDLEADNAKLDKTLQRERRENQLASASPTQVTKPGVFPEPVKQVSTPIVHPPISSS